MPKGIVALTSTTHASGRLLRPRLRSFAFGHNFPYRDKELDFSCCDTFLCVVFWTVAQSQATVGFIKHVSNLPYSCTLFQLENGRDRTLNFSHVRFCSWLCLKGPWATLVFLSETFPKCEMVLPRNNWGEHSS